MQLLQTIIVAKQLVLFSEITGTTRGTNPTQESNDPTSRNLKCNCYNDCAVTKKDVSHSFGMSALIAVKEKILTFLRMLLGMDYKMGFYWLKKVNQCQFVCIGGPVLSHL